MTKLVDLPDFEKVQKLVEEIYLLSVEISKLKLELKFNEAEIISTLTNNPDYFIHGKPMSMTQIQATYALTGLHNELNEKREKLLMLENKLNYKEKQYELYKLLVDLWRTQSANERLKL